MPRRSFARCAQACSHGHDRRNAVARLPAFGAVRRTSAEAGERTCQHSRPARVSASRRAGAPPLPGSSCSATAAAPAACCSPPPPPPPPPPPLQPSHRPKLPACAPDCVARLRRDRTDCFPRPGLLWTAERPEGDQPRAGCRPGLYSRRARRLLAAGSAAAGAPGRATSGPWRRPARLPPPTGRCPRQCRRAAGARRAPWWPPRRQSRRRAPARRRAQSPRPARAR
jgi:hypothetical protein